MSKIRVRIPDTYFCLSDENIQQTLMEELSDLEDHQIISITSSGHKYTIFYRDAALDLKEKDKREYMEKTYGGCD